jgi:hypothetical protein
MRKAIITVLLMIVFALPPAAAAGQRTLRVLFVGNSLSYVNDLPTAFKTIYEASQPGARVEAEMLAQGGALLREHLDAGALESLLARERFDVVVLQELGGLPLCPRDFAPCKDSPKALRDAAAMVRASGSRPVWLATWQALPSAQEELSRRVSTLARELQIDTVDVGAAIQRVAPNIRRHLLAPDGHPRPLGTWLAAAALVARITGEPLPQTAPPASCGRKWRQLRMAKPASLQATETETAKCFQPSPGQWRAVRSAIRVDAGHAKEN